LIDEQNMAHSEAIQLASVAQSLLGLLGDMRAMIARIDDGIYAAPAPGRTSGGIGAHVRHCLDHVSALVNATYTGTCAYDRRSRGTEVETSRVAAWQHIADLEEEVSRIESLFDHPVYVETQLAQGSMVVTQSTIGRELVFVTSHTIHHNAVVVYLLRAHDIEMGPRFGVSPATPDQTRQPA
jgi:hypothetical protein